MARRLDPTNYSALLRTLDGKPEKRLSANCRLRHRKPTVPGLLDSVAVVLHWTTILEFWSDGSVTFNSGGYHTATTKRYMGLAADHAQVFQRDYEWFIVPMSGRPHYHSFDDFDSWLTADKDWRDRVTVPFVDGCRISQDGELIS